MRKKIFFLLIILFTSISASGQIADGITYQAVALDDKGKEIAGHDINGLIIHSKQINVRFSLLSGSPEGELLYKEVHSTYTDPHGLFSLVIGHGEVSPDGLHEKLTDINWGADKLFLMVEIDIRSKGDYKIMGIQQMMAVPFAFHSLSSSTVQYEDILNVPSLSAVAATGNYSDLINLPVLFEGNYNTLSNKPFIPGKTSELTNDAGFLKSFTETDPIWTAVQSNYFTKSNLTTAGASQVHFMNITNRPITLAGYGITDAISKSAPANIITTTNISNWNSAFGWGNHAGLYRSGTWVPLWNDIISNPFTITAPANNQILRYNTSTGKWQNWTPDYLTSYTETDPRWTTASVNYYTKSNLQASGGALIHFNNIISRPTTIAGYGITDAMRTSHPANTITGTNISNWNAAFTWGSHIGLYRPVNWVPSWNDITTNPFSITAPANNQLLRYNSTSGKWQNWTPDFLTGFTETDPLWASASGNYYTRSNLETIGGSRVHFSNIINKPTNLAGYGITDAMRTSHPANMITLADIPNWRMAFSWGNHATAGYTIIPSQTGNNGKYLMTNGTITVWNNLSAVAVSGSYNDLINKPELNGSETKIISGINVSVTGTGTLSSPYVISSSGSGTSTFIHYIGELYGGGIVVSVWKESGVEKGLIASLTDLSTGIPWSNITSEGIWTAQSPTDGQSNTNAIIYQSGHSTSAAKLCDDYSNDETGTGVYSDWYLPAIWELNQCYNAAFIINSILGIADGFAYYQYTHYWSSTEFNDNSAKTMCFSIGDSQNALKSFGSVRVRAVRRF